MIGCLLAFQFAVPLAAAAECGRVADAETTTESERRGGGLDVVVVAEATRGGGNGRRGGGRSRRAAAAASAARAERRQVDAPEVASIVVDADAADADRDAGDDVSAARRR